MLDECVLLKGLFGEGNLRLLKPTRNSSQATPKNIVRHTASVTGKTRLELKGRKCPSRMSSLGIHKKYLIKNSHSQRQMLQISTKRISGDEKPQRQTEIRYFAFCLCNCHTRKKSVILQKLLCFSMTLQLSFMTMKK